MSRPFGYAATLIASEQQELWTAAEHASITGHAAEFIRDVPSSCACAWTWRPGPRAYERISHAPGCPWHTTPGG